MNGQTLKQLIKKRGHLTVPEAIDIMLQLTDGLAHAHDSYIIHRDIKPQNIMILEEWYGKNNRLWYCNGNKCI